MQEVKQIETRRASPAGYRETKQSSNTKKDNIMATGASIQEKVTAFMVKEVKGDLATQVSNNGIKLDDKNIIPSEHSKETLKIVLPDTMNKLQGAHNLIKQFEEEETQRSYNRNYENFFINDFMIAMQVMIPKYFGLLHVSRIDTTGRPAGQNYIQIPIGFNEDGSVKTAKGYVGSIIAPVWQDAILDIFPGLIRVRAKLKFEAQINAFLEDVERSILRESVVRGTAVTIEKRDDGLMAIPILVKENRKIILSDDVNRIVNNLVIPGMKEKRKVSLLFTGDYGVGKTETALKVGIAAKHKFGRTFFYLHNSDMFNDLIPYIKNYAPAVCFIEDIDQISSGDRDTKMNDLLNMLDGNALKNVDCTFIFTTNNHDKIHPAMRRPGRIDQIVHFGYCTPDMVAKIFAAWAEGYNGADAVDYQAAAADCPADLQGAVVAEIARRALQYAENLYEGVLSTERFLDAIASMRHHIEFMKADQTKDHSAENLLGHLLFKGMMKAFPNLATDAPIINGNPLPNFQESTYQGLDN
jgi:hypothetical protein